MENIWNAAGQDVEIPLTEPQRQYYFIDRAKKYLEKMSEAAGRPLTFCVTTFGCQMNARDSEKLTGILEQIGYIEEPEEEKADFVIYNTCTVRENANQRVYGRLGQLQDQKEKSAHDDRTVRLHDAGARSGRKIKKELSFCRPDLRHPQYF